MSFPTGFRSFNGVRNKRLMFRILQYGLLLCLANVNYTTANRVCRKFKSESEETLPYDQINESVLEQCPPSSAPFSVYTAPISGNASTHKALLICWVKDVRSFAVKFDKSADIDDVSNTQGVRVRTCTYTNDTLIYNRKYFNRHVYYLIVKLTVTDKIHFAFRAHYSQKSKGIPHSQHRLIQYKYGSVSDTRKRKKRDTSPTLKTTPASQCGKTRSCYRDGADDCDHFSCTYFVSYNVSNDLVDIEISARTSGWVAIGFSSDRKMGGDEVIACKKVRTNGEADTYSNPYSHDYPRKKSKTNVVNLKQFQIRDGYIFCHFTRNPSLTGYLDLTNEWHQLYAYGPLSAGGDLEKHITPPQVSDKQSIVRRINEYSNCATTSVSSNLIITLLAVLFRITVCNPGL